MAYKVIKSKGSISGLTHREFIVDTAAEITDLPTNKKMGKKQAGDTVSDELCSVGSTASVTETGDVYELNASSTWVKKPTEGSGSGSEITIDSTLTQSGQAADAKSVGDALAAKADSAALSGYVQTSTAEGTYAKKSELSAYATTESLGDYIQTTTADGKYATKSELDSYATTESLTSYMQASTADGKYATKTELNSYATTASLADYAKTSELPKGTAVTDATGEADAYTQLNALLASLRAAGIIANS